VASLIKPEPHVCTSQCQWAKQLGDWFARLKCLQDVRLVHVDTRAHECRSKIWYAITDIQKSRKLDRNAPPRRVTFDIEAFSDDFETMQRITAGLRLATQLQNNRLPFGSTCLIKSACLQSQDESYRQKSPGILKGEFAVFMLLEIQPN